MENWIPETFRLEATVRRCRSWHQAPITARFIPRWSALSRPRLLVEHDGGGLMRAMFANLTRSDFTGRSTGKTRAGERLRVQALVDEIQVAIYHRNFATVDRLMTQLADATASRSRAS